MLTCCGTPLGVKLADDGIDTRWLEATTPDRFSHRGLWRGTPCDGGSTPPKRDSIIAKMLLNQSSIFDLPQICF
jgi:hypothetical protein